LFSQAIPPTPSSFCLLFRSFLMPEKNPEARSAEHKASVKNRRRLRSERDNLATNPDEIAAKPRFYPAR
jgi:hypothetical protein